MPFSILVADSDPNLKNVVNNAANEKDCVITFTQNATDAQTQLMKRKFNLVMVECSLSENQGYSISRVARSRNCPVVMMEERPTRETVLLSIRVGSIDFIVKPLTEENFPSLFARILSNKRLKVKPSFKKIDFDEDLKPTEKVDKVVEKASEVMAFPQTTSKVISLCNDPHIEVAKLEEPIAMDPSVSAMVLKRANSAAFGSSSSIIKLKDALVRIGNRETRSLVVLMSVVKMFSVEAKGFAFNRLAFWGHSLGTGVVARKIADKIKGVKTEDAFLAGILHDIGKLIFDDYLHDEYLEVCKLSQEKQITMHGAEREYFEKTHNIVGSQITELWKLPEEIVNAVSQHHNREIAKKQLGEEITLSCVSYYANQLCKIMGFGTGGDLIVDPIDPAFWQKIGMTDEIDQTLYENAFNELKDFLTTLKISMDRVGVTPAPKTSQGTIFIQDDSSGDLTLDLFFTANGYTVTREPSDDLLFTIYDFRREDKQPKINSEVSGKIPNVTIGASEEQANEIKQGGQPVIELDAQLDMLSLMNALDDASAKGKNS